MFGGPANVTIDCSLRVLFDKDSLHIDHAKIKVGRGDTFLGGILNLCEALIEQLLLILLGQKVEPVVL